MCVSVSLYIPFVLLRSLFAMLLVASLVILQLFIIASPKCILFRSGGFCHKNMNALRGFRSEGQSNLLNTNEIKLGISNTE